MLQEAFQSFQELDSHINSVATKVVYLGDQLESVNTPRSRAVEAQRLMNHFREFLLTGPLVSEVFTDKSKVGVSLQLYHLYHIKIAARIQACETKIKNKMFDIFRKF